MKTHRYTIDRWFDGRRLKRASGATTLAEHRKRDAFLTWLDTTGRTDILDARTVQWASNRIEDYAAEGSAREMWSPYHGTQPGDPAKLGDALVKIAGMENPPKLFVAGSDALEVITPAVEDRLREIHADKALSNSTDGSFQHQI